MVFPFDWAAEDLTGAFDWVRKIWLEGDGGGDDG